MTDSTKPTNDKPRGTGLRVGVVGDVHGHAKELYDMLGALEAHGVDRIILLGDLVDRGPKSRDCLRIGMTLQFQARDGSLRKVEVIKGNHEDAYARIPRGEPKPGRKSMHSPEERGLFKSFSKAELAAMHELPVTISIPELDLICIHGGFEPHCTDPNDHWNCRVRYIDEKGNSLPATSTSDTFWADVYDGRFGFALFGHESHRNPTQYPHAMAVDGEGYRRMHGMVISNEEGDERFTPFTVDYGKGQVASKIVPHEKADRVHDWRSSRYSWSSLTTNYKRGSRRRDTRQRTFSFGQPTRPRFETQEERARRLSNVSRDLPGEDEEFTQEQLDRWANKKRWADDDEEDGEHPFLYIDDQGYEHEWDELIQSLGEDEIETRFTRVPREDWEFDDCEEQTEGDVGIPDAWEEIEPGVYRPLFDL